MRSLGAELVAARMPTLAPAERASVRKRLTPASTSSVDQAEKAALEACYTEAAQHLQAP